MTLKTDVSDVTTNIIVQIIFYIFYGIIFVIGIFGNGLVCYVVIKNPHMQTVTNSFITNLAISDILLCILAVPFTPLYTFIGRWIFGKLMCSLVPYIQGVSIYISTFTLTSIAIDRFFVICHPFRPRIKIKNCLLIIGSIWIASIILTFPYGIYMNIQELYYCEENWPSQKLRKIFGSFTSILQFVLPFFSIAICYICVFVKLNNRSKYKPGFKSSKKEEIDKERTKKTNRMLIAMVTIFGCCWLPINTINIIDDFFADVSYIWKHYRLCFFISHCLAMSSTCYNPLLYAWLNDNFRMEFKKVLPCFDSVTFNLTTKTTTTTCESKKNYNKNDSKHGNIIFSHIAEKSMIQESIQLDLRTTSTTPFQLEFKNINQDILEKRKVTNCIVSKTFKNSFK
ncbi:prolactin-releasing peptide receptor-like [Aphidius gifuensis]|uniref:prolactin-releasing peptide receptor-like n=1 Tax=Aphidius gifuensis TaxID=684658 RepID=UPI001CDD0DE5|nr:prolactin-releasing peptide receptor-like [Aphidius gifuensis]